MEFAVAGNAFDAAAIGPQVTHLVIHRIRKPDLARLAGLADLPIKTLELRWVSAPDLTQVPLPAALEVLDIWQSPKLKSCAGAERAKGGGGCAGPKTAPLKTGECWACCRTCGC